MSQPLQDIAPIRPLLEYRPLVILSDIDGTLAPIVDNPDEASVSTRARVTLEALLDRGVGVGLITGRAMVRAQEMAGVTRAMYAANHGLNIHAGHGIEAPEALRGWVEKAQLLLPSLADLEKAGVSVEDKGPIIALHYRRATNEDEARGAILAAATAAAANGFRVQEGRKVVEIRPPIDISKRTAAVELARRMKARAVLCMGDDLTDVDLFDGVRSLRAEGVDSVIVAVLSPEIQEKVLAAADYSVEGVEGVEALLEGVLSALSEIAQSNQ
ncbi:MAG TPA: trehalose-phosphatase [Dehalococcoidia bacterium]|nr:trehalose-phosphatase [Dehalococcoidia bacterium]